MTVLLALFMTIRVVAQPVILAAPEPGVMALCSGGKIVYVSIETGLPVEPGDDTGVRADPCPFFGVTAFDLSTATPGPAPVEVVMVQDLEPVETITRVTGFSGQNGARAPPATA